MLKVIGIDPGLKHTGWAIIGSRNSQFFYIASGRITTNINEELYRRLLDINCQLTDVIQIYCPHTAAIEITYVNKNYGSSLKLAHARGAAIVTLAALKLAVDEYPAKTIKKTICGNGQAEKIQIERMMSIIFPSIKLQSLDESDALSVALCHAMHVCK